MYLLRRLGYLPVSLILLSFICFGLRSLTPGDPVVAAMSKTGVRGGDAGSTAYDRQYLRTAERLNLHLPAFYVSLQNGALPDTLHRIVRRGEREMLRVLTLRYGNWPEVAHYYERLRYLVDNRPPVLNDSIRAAARRLMIQDDPEKIEAMVARLKRAAPDVARAYEAIQSNASPARLLVPRLRWHGANNQYHRWLTGDYGRSTITQRPVMDEIRTALPRTLVLNGLAILLVFIVSIPLGLYLASVADSTADVVISTLLFGLYGIPSFWVATLAANFLTTPAYGIDLFPSMGFGEVPAGAGTIETFGVRASHLFLPVLCLAYPAWAYVTRHLRASSLVELRKAYVTTARMKGLGRWAILFKHVLRNASFPLVTIVGSLFPAMLGGSILIERIFNLPGMGKLLYTAASLGDWPVITALVMINGILTALGLLVADLVYALIDPRVRLAGARQIVLPR